MKIPQDFDPTALARVYGFLLEKLDDDERERVQVVARRSPGLYLRSLDDGYVELYLRDGDGSKVPVGAVPERFLMDTAIVTDN